MKIYFLMMCYTYLDFSEEILFHSAYTTKNIAEKAKKKYEDLVLKESETTFYITEEKLLEEV